jgi:glycosyltransferase involved in cell wall biosynthesis
VTDRLTDRGGAHWHLLGILAHQRGEHEVHLAVGADPGHVAPPCPLTLVSGLDARDRQPCRVELDAVAARVRPDVIHVHTVVNPDALEWAAERGALMTVQDHRYFCPTRGRWTRDGRACREPMRPEVCVACFEDEAYFREVYALTAARLAALQRLPRVVVLSDYMRAELAAMGVAGERIAVVPPFVHGLDPRAAPDGPPCVLFVGRLADAKGVWDAVAAWRQSGIEPPLLFAGTGPRRADLEREGHTVLGWLPHDRLSSLYRRARVVLMPSRWQEPFGIVGLEALSLGAPVAAWDSGGVREWHTDDGLAAWGDVAGLAKAARRLAGQKAEPPEGFEAAGLMGRLSAVYGEILRANTNG